MITCHNCGQQNPEGDLFCRRCGISFRQGPPAEPRKEDFETAPPRPYSWKSGEYPAGKKGSRATRRININSDPQAYANQQIATQSHGPVTAGYRCPRCGTRALPIVTRRISTAGWIVFGTLLITTLFLFWIGLLLREDARVCPVCNLRVG